MYIGVFDTREKAALAYEISRDKLKSQEAAVLGTTAGASNRTLSSEQAQDMVAVARKAAFDGVH